MRRYIFFFSFQLRVDYQDSNKIANKNWWSGVDLNHRHKPFQGSALPTELPDHAQSFSTVYLNNQLKTKLN